MFHSTGASGGEKYHHSYVSTWCILGQSSQQTNFQKDSVAIRCSCSQQSSTLCAFLTKTWHFEWALLSTVCCWKSFYNSVGPYSLVSYGLIWLSLKVRKRLNHFFYKPRFRLLLGLQLKWRICFHDSGNRNERQTQHFFNWMENKLQIESLPTIGESSFQGLSVW